MEKNFQILIIDDHDEIRENISEILQLAGYSVKNAENGKIGLEKAITEPPDLIICDIMMPELDGYGVLHLLRKNPETMHIPLIFLTAKTERADFRKGMEMGADDFITKPFDDMELLSAVESRLKKVELLKHKYSQDQPGINTFLKDLDKHGILPLDISQYDTQFFQKNQQIYREGQRPRNMYQIIQGKVKTYRIHPDGKEYITNFLGASDYLGYLNLLEDGPYLENATALENSELLIIPKEDFQKRVTGDSQVLLAFVRLLSKALSQKEERLLELAYGTLRKRVATALVDIFKKNKEAMDSKAPMSINREDLAQYIGTAKESAIRVLSEFREEKLIQIREGKISIPNIEKLENLAY